MKKSKSIDAMALKRRLQAQVRRTHQRLGEREATRQFQHWLNTSDDSLAVFWRGTKPIAGTDALISKSPSPRRKKAS